MPWNVVGEISLIFQISMRLSTSQEQKNPIFMLTSGSQDGTLKCSETVSRQLKGCEKECLEIVGIQKEAQEKRKLSMNKAIKGINSPLPVQ